MTSFFKTLHRLPDLKDNVWKDQQIKILKDTTSLMIYIIFNQWWDLVLVLVIFGYNPGGFSKQNNMQTFP